MPDALTLRVGSITKATPGSRILSLELGDTPFSYQAGQAVMLGLHGQSQRRPYSIASAPEETAREGRLEFLIKVDSSGAAGQHLAGVRRGSSVDVEGPFGAFRFPEHLTERRVLFIAGGTGISPLRSMLWHTLLTERDVDISVLYSARAAEEFAYAAELRRLARDERISVTFTVTRDAGPDWRGDRGRINAHRLAPLVHDPATLCFICGPASLLESVPPLLAQLGVPRTRIRMEEW